MEKNKSEKAFQILIGYYGVLQSLHLLSLARAGWLIVRTGQIPFPAPPPSGGWPADSIPYLIGMGITDIFAILLGLIFVYQYLFKRKLLRNVSLISLTMALSSGVVYLIGTLPSGAWQAHFGAYLLVIVVFSPVIPLYILLLRYLSKA